MKLIELAKSLLKARMDRDITYERFVSSRRFRLVKREFKREIKENARKGYGRISSDCYVTYRHDMYDTGYVTLSDKEFEYLKTYYESEGFEVEIYNDDKDSQDKYNTLIIIWSNDSLY